MAKYDKYGRPELPPLSKRLEQPHPMWGPLGCGMSVALLVLALGAAEWFFEANRTAHWVTVPAELLLPSRVTVPLLGPVSIDPLLGVKALVGLAAALMGYALLGLGFALASRAMGVTYYTPMDLRAPVRRRRLRVASTLRRWAPWLAFPLGVVGVHWAIVRKVFTPSPAWLVQGPLPYALLYIVAWVVAWGVLTGLAYLLGVMLAGLARLLAGPPAEDEEV